MVAEQQLSVPVHLKLVAVAGHESLDGLQRAIGGPAAHLGVLHDAVATGGHVLAVGKHLLLQGGGRAGVERVEG